VFFATSEAATMATMTEIAVPMTEKTTVLYRLVSQMELVQM
jgi:hypothetical protein